MKLATPYSELNAVFASLLENTQTILNENFVGLYIVGSFALGDFDTDSDADFLVVTHADVTEAQEAALQTMHGQIYDLEIPWTSTPWAKHLEGSYISKELLRRPDPLRTPLLYLDNTARVLERSDHCNKALVRWTLREHGIVLAGPDPKTLVDPVSPTDLRQESLQIMPKLHAWAKEVLTPEAQNNRWSQSYVLISSCRLLYTMREGTITSKLQAVRWAQANLESHWHDLIERAWQDRPNPSLKSRLQADPDDSRDTLEFVKYVHEMIDGEH
jgi:predicted nucleotidyltransferase